MCGNAALCVTRLASRLGLAAGSGMTIETDDGIVRSRLVDDRPEIELQPVRNVQETAGGRPATGERRLGYAVAGVPHIVVLCEEVDRIDVAQRGQALRTAEWTMPDGANVNFVSDRRGPVGDPDLRARRRGRDSSLRNRRRGDRHLASRLGSRRLGHGPPNALGMRAGSPSAGRKR